MQCRKLLSIWEKHMSGHSKWATIKHKKAALDAKRGKIFTKLLKEITVVARDGGGDPSANPRLRTLIEKARRANMPHENLQRAIKKGTGELPGQTYEAQNYEGYGPGGIAVIVDVLTDNKNRAVADLRHAFSRHGGRLGETGSVGWMFEFVGVIRVSSDKLTEEELMEILLEYPIEDIVDEQEVFAIIMEAKALDKVRQMLQEHNIEIKSSDLEWVPKNRVALASVEEGKALEFLNALDELDDVQNIYSNL
jgi:YebC/PmpR family DNA-binding regulatory protein